MTSILTPSIILLMIGNTIAASGAALVAWQTFLLHVPEPATTMIPEEHFSRLSVRRPTLAHPERRDRSDGNHYGG